MGIDRTLIARQLYNLLPPLVQRRVLRDNVFTSQYGPLSKTILTIGDSISIDQLELLAAGRRALAGQGTQSVNDVSGHQILIAFEHNTVALKLTATTGTEQLANLPELLILSHSRDDRKQAFDRMIDRFGPTAPDFLALQKAVEERELTYEEIADLLEEMTTGFEAHRTRIALAHNSDKIQLEDIVPGSLSYYERFCGPNPLDVKPEEYLTGELPFYRHQLLSRNVVRGLEICLFGALRDDLAPTAWIGKLSDDEIWKALETINIQANPFMLLGVLDIAISRQHDERYRNLADETMGKLLQERLLRPDGVDSYEILPLFAQLVLDRINILEGGALREPFWKRMCAWMHACLLLQSTLHIEIKLEPLREWVTSRREMAGTYAQMLDLHREPMYRAGQITPSFLREEIIGRLVALRDRHEAAGHVVPRSVDIDAAMTHLNSNGSPLGWAMPGPLDGHRRPNEVRSLSETDANQVLEDLLKDPHGVIWSKLAYFSQCIHLGEKILERASDIISKTSLDVDALDRNNKFGRLLDICLVAAAHRSKDLARSISSTTLAIAPHAHAENASTAILHILLLASAAFERDNEWSDWIEEQLERLAHRLPHGEATRILIEHLNEIKKVLPFIPSICSRAEAVASAAS